MRHISLCQRLIRIGMYQPMREELLDLDLRCPQSMHTHVSRAVRVELEPHFADRPKLLLKNMD